MPALTPMLTFSRFRSPFPARHPLVAAAVLLGALLLALPAAGGTWQWRDAAGRMVYSDQPPPPGVPATQILRAPAQGGSGSAPASAAAAPPSAAVQAPAAAAPATWVEREQASRKRNLEREEEERRQREARDESARAARSCQDARTALRTLESGMRISTVTAGGEREVIDEAERARRIDAARQEISRSCAKAG